MRKAQAVATLFFGLSLCLLPALVLGMDTKMPFGGSQLNEHAENLSTILFGPIARIAAIFGGVTGIIYGLIQHSITKIATFGGILLVSVALPKFINGFYTMLLP